MAPDDLPKPAMKKTTIQLRMDLHRWLKVRAAEQGRHIQDFINEAVEQYQKAVTRKDASKG